MTIRQLPAAIANQIAAGEVIERPASVVKELLENAADANATAISIEIGFGGLNQIKISDNGDGIIAAELPLAIAAHATSKILNLADLYNLRSFGFRGEALASIASIAHLTISSKPANQAHAMVLTNQQGIEIKPCARSQGTTIDVRSLFYNAPVRKKFLKSESHEFQAIDRVVRQFAMSQPTIALTLSHNGKLQFQLAAAHNHQTETQRMSRLLGRQFASQTVFIEVEQNGWGLKGWLANPNYQRNQSDKQWFYLNGRFVRDKLINHAVKQAYDAVLLPGKHPACLLYLTWPTTEVDVNVHPTKHEVRFQQPRLVHDFIVNHIQQALATPVMPLEEPPRQWQLSEMRPAPLFIAESQPKAVIDDKITSQSMIRVDKQYTIATILDQVYLVDVQRLQAAWFKDRLAQQAWPLASRPLLVPVRYRSEALDEAQQTLAANHLAIMGIAIQWVSATECLVKSLPVIAPNVAINPLLSAVLTLKDQPDHESLLNLLVDHQTSCLSEQEQIAFNAYMLSKSGQSNCYKQLTPVLCRDLIDV